MGFKSNVFYVLQTVFIYVLYIIRLFNKIDNFLVICQTLPNIRDEPILLFFLPIFLSGNSFIFNLFF